MLRHANCCKIDFKFVKTKKNQTNYQFLKLKAEVSQQKIFQYLSDFSFIYLVWRGNYSVIWPLFSNDTYLYRLNQKTWEPRALLVCVIVIFCVSFPLLKGDWIASERCKRRNDHLIWAIRREKIRKEERRGDSHSLVTKASTGEEKSCIRPWRPLDITTETDTACICIIIIQKVMMRSPQPPIHSRTFTVSA